MKRIEEKQIKEHTTLAVEESEESTNGDMTTVSQLRSNESTSNSAHGQVAQGPFACEGTRGQVAHSTDDGTQGQVAHSTDDDAQG